MTRTLITVVFFAIFNTVCFAGRRKAAQYPNVG